MAYTIEARRLGASKWEPVPFVIADREDGVTAVSELSRWVNATEFRLLDDGELVLTSARSVHKSPQVQNLPKDVRPQIGVRLVPSKAPIWECAAVRRRQQTADAAGFLWRNGHGMWNASSLAHLQAYLRGSSVGRIIDDAEDLQLTISTATADKIQSVLVGYVARVVHYPRCPCKVCTP